jgi:WD40 repeat protein
VEQTASVDSIPGRDQANRIASVIYSVVDTQPDLAQLLARGALESKDIASKQPVIDAVVAALTIPIHISRTLTGHTITTSIVSSVAISPDGKTLATGSGDHTVRLWDVATGKAIRTLSLPSLPVSEQDIPSTAMSVAFEPDGKTLAVAYSDGRVRLWNVATGTATYTFNSPGVVATSIAVAADSRTMATGFHDSTVRILP